MYRNFHPQGEPEIRQHLRYPLTLGSHNARIAIFLPKVRGGMERFLFPIVQFAANQQGEKNQGTHEDSLINL